MTAPLIQLLEPTTAEVIKDNAVPDLPIDLRPVNYLFTANSIEGVSEPILSRLLVIEIPSPTEEQSVTILKKQFDKLCKGLSSGFQPPVLGENAIDALSKVSPRRQRHLLRLALGRSIHKNQRVIEIEPEPQAAAKKMGFL